jgi:hypothetical protein
MPSEKGPQLHPRLLQLASYESGTKATIPSTLPNTDLTAVYHALSEQYIHTHAMIKIIDIRY